jgi:hypothetical protein
MDDLASARAVKERFVGVQKRERLQAGEYASRQTSPAAALISSD